MLAWMWGERNTNSLLVGMQTGAATMEFSGEFPERAVNRFTTGPSSITCGQYPKDAFLIHAHYCSMHNSQEMEIA